MEKRANILALATKVSLESMTYTGITYKDPVLRIFVGDASVGQAFKTYLCGKCENVSSFFHILTS